MKRKSISVIAVLLTCFLMSVNVFAEEQQTTITTEIPECEDADYVLLIPEDKQITYGATSTMLSPFRVTFSEHFSETKNLEVKIVYSGLINQEDEYELPMSLVTSAVGDGGIEWITIASGDTVVFEGQSDGSLSEYATLPCGLKTATMWLDVKQDDWNSAYIGGHSGSYSSTITYAIEVVNEV